MQFSDYSRFENFSIFHRLSMDRKASCTTVVYVIRGPTYLPMWFRSLGIFAAVILGLGWGGSATGVDIASRLFVDY
jgi:hypothetical protein